MLQSTPNARTFIGTALNNLGWAHYRAGRPEQAMDCYHRAVAIGHEVGSQHSVSYAEGNLALVYADNHHPAEALAHWQQALWAARQSGDRLLEANSLTGVAKARIALGAAAAAQPDLWRALAIYLELGDDSVTAVQGLLAAIPSA